MGKIKGIFGPGLPVTLYGVPKANISELVCKNSCICPWVPIPALEAQKVGEAGVPFFISVTSGYL